MKYYSNIVVAQVNASADYNYKLNYL